MRYLFSTASRFRDILKAKNKLSYEHEIPGYQETIPAIF